MSKKKNVKYFVYELTETYFVPIKFVGEDTEENRRKALEEANRWTGGVDFEAPNDYAEQWSPVGEDEYNDCKEGDYDGWMD